MSKSGKVHISVTIFKITFFGKICKKTVSTDLKSAGNSAFLMPFYFFRKIFFKVISVLFKNFVGKRAKKTSVSFSEKEGFMFGLACKINSCSKCFQEK
jgi:hypothetical protein